MKSLLQHLMAIGLLLIPIYGITQDTDGSLSMSVIEETTGVFAFAYNSSGKAATSAAIDASKYKTALGIFDKLIEAKGVKNMPRPTFIMDNAERRPAWTHPAKAIVVLEEKAFDLCVSLGKDSANAIAALLSHELIHYYEKHDWSDRFATESGTLLHSDDATGASPELISEMALELQADHLGGLLAHMAGYKTLGVLPALLPKLYDAYNLEGERQDEYPSLDERRAIARTSDVMLTKHSRLFDMATYMIAAGSYDLALQYLDYLLVNTQFQSREIYNNIGVLYTLIAMEAMPASKLTYRLPLELDMKSRLATRSQESERIQELLDKAIYNFKNASILDKSYAPSLLNLASAYTLQENYFDASYHAQKALQLYKRADDERGISDAKVVLGIIAASEGDKEAAREHLLTAQSDLARINLCILRGSNDCLPAERKSRKSASYSDIDEVDLNQLYTRIMRDQEKALLSIELNATESFHTIAKEHSEILVSLSSTNMGAYEFYQVIKNEQITYATDIRVGQSVDDVIKELGQPNTTYGSQGRSLLIYNNESLIIVLDDSEKIIEWCLFKSNQS